MDLSWEDIVWEDPDGGSIVLHGVIPTVVLPTAMRPRIKWNGLGIIGNSEEPEVWIEEEKSETEDSGVNLDSGIMNGGLDGMYLEMLTWVEGLQVGKFPDPEPMRLYRAAVKHDRPIFFAEPDFDDEDWLELMEKEAKEMTRPRKLLRIVFTGRRFRKTIKKMRKHVVVQPSREPDGLQAASALAATWWKLNRDNSTEALHLQKEKRMAARLRGGLAKLREEFGDDAVMIVPIQQASRAGMENALNSHPDPEEVSSPTTLSGGEEE